MKDVVEFFEGYVKRDGATAVDYLAATVAHKAVWMLTPNQPWS